MAPPASNTPVQPVEFPFDILHYIFAFLKSDPKSLIACSDAHPSLSPIVEKHLYYHITIETSSGYPRSHLGYPLVLSQLLELLSETPQIANHVRVLQLTFNERHSNEDMAKYEQIAGILPSFPLVKCLILRSMPSISWQAKLPQTLKMAVENCLRLPTMHEIHIGTALIFPLSLLNKHADITHLSFSAHPQIPDRPDDTYPPLQLKSLKFECLYEKYSDTFTSWTKPHITTLRSLQCEYSSEPMILEFLDVCSGTLSNLDLEIRAPYGTFYYIKSGRVSDDHPPPEPLINLSSLPHLRHLTIRVVIYHDYADDLADEDRPEYPQAFCASCLPTAVKILKTASSSLQHLTIEIDVDKRGLWRKIDFSPLTMLAETSASFQRIDLYAMFPFDKVYPKLARYEGLKKLIKQNVLIIHAEQSAPGVSQFE